jgi:hypothetical protein
LAKLTIRAEGISLSPTLARFRGVWNFLGVPTLDLEWSGIDAIELMRGPFDCEASRGFSFVIGGQRLIFWTYAIEAVLDELDRYAPQELLEGVKPKRRFSRAARRASR